MRQILLHPGFHKTGTSAIQHFLWVNRVALAPYVDLRLFRHLKPIVETCAQFSRSGDPLDLIDFVSKMDAFSQTYPLIKNRDLVVSCKGLCGHLPGNKMTPNYDAVPTLLTYVAGYFAEKYPDAQVKVIFTTRAPEPWLFSVYRQRLRADRMTMTFEQFKGVFTPMADLDRVVTDVAEALAPLPVMFLPMEDAIRHPLGPGAAIVDLLNVPEDVRRDLVPVGRDAQGPEPAIWQQFLALNSSNQPDRAVAMAKAEIAASIDLGGWKKI